MAARISVARAAHYTNSLRAAAYRRPLAGFQSTWQQPPQSQRWRPFSISIALKEKKYTEDHEWAELSADGKTCTLGISNYASNALGDVIFVELPELDLEVKQNDVIGAVESVKSASDILTPVSGKIAETNKALEEKPALLNKDPEGEGWIAKIEVKDVKELDNLMDAQGYKKFTED